MQKAAPSMSVAAYLKTLTPERRAVVAATRDLVNAHIPDGYQEFVFWGMITWGIPLARFPNTYNGQPLCIVAIGDRKDYVSLYLMGVYGSPKLLTAFKAGFTKAGKKLNMGKACVRYASLDQVAVDAIAQAVAAVTPAMLIEAHDAAHSPAAKAARRATRATAKSSSRTVAPKAKTGSKKKTPAKKKAAGKK